MIRLEVFWGGPEALRDNDLAPKYLENSPTDLLPVLHDLDWSGGILGLDPGHFESGCHMIIPRGMDTWMIHWWIRMY